MRFNHVLLLLAVSICMPAEALGQPGNTCLPPGSENFDSLAVSGGSATCATPGVLPAGWATEATAARCWDVRSVNTPSSGTGPSGDHTGGGNYIYMESSTPAQAGEFAIIYLRYDADPTLVTTPTFEFWYHMWDDFGGLMGTLEVAYYDATAGTGGTGDWVTVWSRSQDQGPNWLFAQIILPGGGYNLSGTPPFAQTCASGVEVLLRVKAIRGPSFLSDIALDDVRFGNPTPPDYDTNTTGGSLDIDGVETTGFFSPAVVTKQIGCGSASTVSGIIDLSSNASGPVFDVVLSPDPIVAAGTLGSLVFPTGQILNLDLSNVPAWSSLNGGGPPFNLSLQPFAGGGIPGASGGGIVVPFVLGTPLTVSMQAVVAYPGAVGGFELTQAVQLDVLGLPAGAPSVPGPSLDETLVAVDVTCPPSNYITGGFSFYGSTYTTLYVLDNGRVSIDSGGTDWSPTPAEALSRAFWGYWTDLDTGSGSVTITGPAPNVVRIDFTNVNNFGSATPNTYAMELDANTGVVSILGMAGIATAAPTSSDTILGISAGTTTAGGPASDPGPILFNLGLPPTSPVAPADMIYDIFVGSQVPASLFGTGLNRIDWIPNGNSYDWTAQ